MDIKEYAAGLGIDLSTDTTIKSEIRYIIIVELVHNKRRYTSTNKIPDTDILRAKEMAFARFKKLKIKSTDLITFRCLEIKYADVPIESVLTPLRIEMQPVFSKWLTPEELKLLITNENTGNSIEETGISSPICNDSP